MFLVLVLLVIKLISSTLWKTFNGVVTIFLFLFAFRTFLKIESRILNEAFSIAISEAQYKNVYRGVFPIKVCQQRHVVEEIQRFGAKYQYGLEAGSKAELLIVLATLKTPGALVTCNGYKDSEYIETALLAQQVGLSPFIILEKLPEVYLIIQAAKKLNIRPLIGVRAKLSARGMGRWAASAGDGAKFGLTASEIYESVQVLRKENMLDCLQLLHFHVGSQISNIKVVKTALREAACFFVDLFKLGAAMRYADCGGGLGIDYDGTSLCHARAVMLQLT